MRTAAIAGVAAHAGKKAGEQSAERAESQQAPSPPPDAGATDRKIEQLEELAKLRDNGVLDDAEFRAEKQKILQGS